jgi:thiol-disulfide isomerase/thioredoxin
MPIATNEHAHAQHTGPAGAALGETAPALVLPDLDGRVVDLTEFCGERTLVLFWNPECGFCQQMLPDLRAWDRQPPSGSPKLLVVSTGPVEANRSMGLKSTVVLEPSFSAGFTFGVNGTPSAVLVDAWGRIASRVGVGASAVMALARADS